MASSPNVKFELRLQSLRSSLEREEKLIRDDFQDLFIKVRSLNPIVIDRIANLDNTIENSVKQKIDRFHSKDQLNDLHKTIKNEMSTMSTTISLDTEVLVNKILTESKIGTRLSEIEGKLLDVEKNIETILEKLEILHKTVESSPGILERIGTLEDRLKHAHHRLTTELPVEG